MHVATLMLNRGRGSGGVARQHARALESRGHTVTFLLPDPRPETRFDQRPVTLSTEVFPVHEFLPSAGDRQHPVSAMDGATASALIDDYRDALLSLDVPIDAIVAHHANLTAPAAAEAARELGVPYVVFAHGTGVEPRHHGGYDDSIWARIRDAVEAADGVIVTTDYVRDQLVLPLLDVDIDRFTVIPCGIDLVEFHPDAAADVVERYDLPDVYVICPGALTTVKGPQNVVEASLEFADLAPVVFIGDGDLREQLEDELGDRGRFLGFVPDEDKAALINAATVLAAAPEKKEHFGIIYAEALAGGTVPVAYEGGGVASIVTDDVGVLTERSPQALGSVVRRVLGDPNLAGMAAAGRRRAESLFDERHLGANLVDWLERVVDGAGGTA